MAILSNYTPDCRVKAFVECEISDLNDPSLGMSAEEFAEKFARAIRISKVDVTRATTHNKGIFNGIDAVVVATGNDYRAVEACGHAYAARDGQYRGLSDVSLENGKFRFSLEIPLAIGTVGGLTSLHPLARLSLMMLGRPSASELMKIVATIGLAQNFAAVRSLITSGIQKGHMKMHLMNILNHLEASEKESEQAKKYFENEVISFKSVREFVSGLRNYIK
jgi:hydroxymethylglutaryl-CoA reductase